LFDFAKIWYEVQFRDSGYIKTFKVKGSEVEVIAWHNVSAVRR